MVLQGRRGLLVCFCIGVSWSFPDFDVDVFKFYCVKFLLMNCVGFNLAKHMLLD